VQTAIDWAFLPAAGRRILTDHFVTHPRDSARRHQLLHEGPAAPTRLTVRPYCAALITKEPRRCGRRRQHHRRPDPVRCPSSPTEETVRISRS
jgi:hypothetical protein